MDVRRVTLGALATVGVLSVGLGVRTASAEDPPPTTGKVIIIKNTTRADGAFRFSLTAPSAGPPLTFTAAIFTSGHTGTATIADVPPGPYTLTEADAPGWDLRSFTCDAGQTDTVDRGVALAVAAGDVITCTVLNSAEVSITKAVTSGPTMVAGHPDQFDLGYTVTVINNGDRKVVNMVDGLLLGAGVARVGGPNLTSTPGFTVDPLWNASTHADMGTATMIAGETMILSFTIRVQVAAGTPAAARDCDPPGLTLPIQRTGTLNLAAANVDLPQTDNDPVYFATACAPLSTLTLQAQITNDNGGTLALSGVTLTASAGATTVLTGTGGATGAVGTDALTLAGTDAAGYTKSAFTCTGATVTGNSVSVPPGADAVCVIAYDDPPPATTTSTTTTTTTTTTTVARVASTLPPTGTRAQHLAGTAFIVIGVGGLLLLLAGLRRPRAARSRS